MRCASGTGERAGEGDPGHLTPPRLTSDSERAPSAPPAEEQRRRVSNAVGSREFTSDTWPCLGSANRQILQQNANMQAILKTAVMGLRCCIANVTYVCQEVQSHRDDIYAQKHSGLM